MNWLLDVCPPDYRAYPALRRQPKALAWLAARHVAAQREAMHRGLGGVRAELAGQIDAAAVHEVVEVLELEQVRMLSIGRSVALIADAL